MTTDPLPSLASVERRLLATCVQLRDGFHSPSHYSAVAQALRLLAAVRPLLAVLDTRRHLLNEYEDAALNSLLAPEPEGGA